MKKLFGTDGIRGVANTNPMTPEMMLKVGRAAAYKLKDRHKRCRVIIGKDTRLSGYMIETSLSAGICSMGVDVLLVGPLPTPGVAYLTVSMRCDAGVVISASHNPYEDNGIKFFSSRGLKLPDELEAEIEKIVFGNHIDEMRPTATDVGKAFRIDDASGRYIVFAKNSFPSDYTLEGLKVVVDCANGSAYKVAPSVFDELHADVIPYMNEPDGRNINRDCGALHPEKVSEIVLREKADIGIALDGDSDRVILVDSKGNIVDGDKILGMSAKYMKEKGILATDSVIATSMSNFGLEKYLKENSLSLVRTDVGDRYVVDEMLKGGHNLGGEQSGHIIFRDHNFTGDGIVTALQVLAIMKATGMSLFDLSKDIETVPQVLLNSKVREKKKIDSMPLVKKVIDEANKKLEGRGFAVVRYSGTENKVRVMVQSDSENITQTCATDIMTVLKNEIGED